MQLIALDCVKECNQIAYMVLAPGKFKSRSDILFDMTIDLVLSSVDICCPKDPEFFLQLLQMYQRSIEAQSS